MGADISGKTRDRPSWRLLCVQNSSSQKSAIAKERGICADGQGLFTQEISSRTSSHDHRPCLRSTEGVVNRGTVSPRPGPHNIELSCPAESPTRSPPTDLRSAPDEPKMHPRGQLQRLVTLIPLHISSPKYFSLFQPQVFLISHKRAGYGLIVLRH